MTQVNQPEVTVNIVGANVSLANSAQQILVIGQQVSGSVSGELILNIQDDNSWDTLFGANSQIAGMIRDIRKFNKETELDAIPLDDAGAGVNATGTFAITGTATEDGTITFIVGSEENFSFEIAITDGDTATAIGAALETAILANANVPTLAANTTGTVLLTADNAGTLGNSIGLEVNGSVAGVAVVITAMASGATDPTLTGVFDAIGDKRYQTIIWPYADVSELVTFLDARFNVSNEILDGIGVTAQTDTLANHLVILGLLNSQSLIYNVDKTTDTTTHKGPSQMEIPYSKAAQLGGVRALRLTADANISQFVISTNGSLDGFGGPAIASKPYFNTNMPNLPLTDVGKGFTKAQVEQLLNAGGMVIGNNQARNGVVLGEVVTTYKTDIAGNPDVSFTFANFVDTSSNAREYFANNLKKRFAQSRLTTGDVQKGRDMANQIVIAGILDGLYQDLSGPDFVLVQAGEDALRFFKANRTIVINLEQGRATITMKVPLVTQLREIIATMQIAFSLNG